MCLYLHDKWFHVGCAPYSVAVLVHFCVIEEGMGTDNTWTIKQSTITTSLLKNHQKQSLTKPEFKWQKK